MENINDKWKKYSIYPKEMLEPRKITHKLFPDGSIAGSIGKKINEIKKPGLNEDGVMILANGGLYFVIIIDGHYSRDITETMLDEFSNYIGKLDPNLINNDVEEIFIKITNEFSRLTIEKLDEIDAIGEASFIIALLLKNQKLLCVYSVGDLMVFIHCANRQWQPYYQLGQRHFYEWINRKGIMGYHLHFIKLETDTKILITTDGLIDKPTIHFQDIIHIFDDIENIKSNNLARELVNSALTNNSDDDNIACIIFNL